jgi:hypothetical protein
VHVVAEVPLDGVADRDRGVEPELLGVGRDPRELAARERVAGKGLDVGARGSDGGAVEGRARERVGVAPRAEGERAEHAQHVPPDAEAALLVRDVRPHGAVGAQRHVVHAEAARAAVLRAADLQLRAAARLGGGELAADIDAGEVAREHEGSLEVPFTQGPDGAAPAGGVLVRDGEAQELRGSVARDTGESHLSDRSSGVLEGRREWQLCGRHGGRFGRRLRRGDRE